jgi:sulfite reductase alpha subunit
VKIYANPSFAVVYEGEGRMKENIYVSDLCRRLADGPSPSHVQELAQSRYPLAMYEHGLKANRSAYGPDSRPPVEELAGGVGVRSSRLPDCQLESPYIRLLAPVGGWLHPDTLEALADFAECFGEGHIHLSTGGAIEIYLPRDQVLPAVKELNRLGLDVGSTGDGIRCIISCCGQARCDAALVDANAIAHYLGQRFIAEQQYPSFPHKVKTAVAGCPNDCVRAGTQKDHSFIGVFNGGPIINQEELERWLKAGKDPVILVQGCLGKALTLFKGEVLLDANRCISCMHCINICPAFRPGINRGVAWVAGGKYGSRGPEGPMPGLVLIPFIPLTPGDYSRIGDIYGSFLELWDAHGKEKERIGDFICRFGPEQVLANMDAGICPDEV